jgi:hypothetical protein
VTDGLAFATFTEALEAYNGINNMYAKRIYNTSTVVYREQGTLTTAKWKILEDKSKALLAAPMSNYYWGTKLTNSSAANNS